MPKDRVIPLSWSLDHVGPIARTARDCALVLSVIAGHDEHDPASSPAPVEDYARGLTGDLTGMRIGVDRLDAYAMQGIDEAQPRAFDAALEALVPMYYESVAVNLVVLLSEAHSYHAVALRERWDGFATATRALFAAGDSLTADDYLLALRVRRLVCERVAELFSEVDLVVTPTGHLGAPFLRDLDPADAFSAMPSLHTPYWNTTGNPTVAIPLGLGSQGTPLSRSISVRPWDEGRVLQAADAVQQRLPVTAAPRWLGGTHA